MAADERGETFGPAPGLHVPKLCPWALPFQHQPREMARRPEVGREHDLVGLFRGQRHEPRQVDVRRVSRDGNDLVDGTGPRDRLKRFGTVGRLAGEFGRQDPLVQQQ